MALVEAVVEVLVVPVVVLAVVEVAATWVLVVPDALAFATGVVEPALVVLWD